MSADIRLSQQVREVLGLEGVRQVQETPLGSAVCPECQSRVPAAGPVNVVVSMSGPHGKIMFCHLRCSPSVVMASDFEVSDLLPDESSMNMTALLLAYGAVELPVLVADRPVVGWQKSPAADELTDIVVSALLARGMALISRLKDAPRALQATPALLTYAPDGDSQLLIEPVPGDLFYEGTVQVGPEWRAAVDRYGWCVLYSGSNLRDRDSGDITVPSLRKAASAGALVGVRLPISWQTPGSGGAPTAGPTGIRRRPALALSAGNRSIR